MENQASSQLSFRQGLVLLEFGSDKHCVTTLRQAVHQFKQAALLNPNFCQAWHAWANGLVLIASLSGQKEALLESRVKIEKALELLTPNAQDLELKLHWDAGIIYHKLAQISGEIDELFTSIGHFEKSASLVAVNRSQFWNDFGKVFQDLAEKINDSRPLLQATLCFKKSILHTLSHCEGWIGLGKSLKRLYSFTDDETHFRQACDCLTIAIDLTPHRIELSLEKIEFLIDGARVKKEVSKLWAVLESCQQLETVMSSSKKKSLEYAYFLGLWAEALALLGEWNDRIEFIRESENKINAAVELLDEDSPAILHLHGKCLYSFAGYYHDIDLYYLAIEQFQTSLSMDRTQWHNWVWLGATYREVFDLTDDLDAHAKAVRFYHKALQIKPDAGVYFELASLLIQIGEIHHQIEPLEKAVQYLEYILRVYEPICHKHPEWFYEHGIALDLLGDLKEDEALHHQALMILGSALIYNPHDAWIHHRIGMVYSHLGEATEETDHFIQALHHLRLSERLAPEQETVYVDWGVVWMNFAEYTTDAAVAQNCFYEAEQKLMQAAQLGSEHAFYPLACLYSLQGRCTLALSYLHKARVAETLPPLEEILDDAWLEKVQLTLEFQEFLALLQKN